MTTATRYWTWLQMWTEVSDEMDVADEDFVDKDELRGIANKAIDQAEALIHTTNEGYFLTKADLALVSGTEEYALPSDIYAMKIQRILYVEGQTIYEVDRITSFNRYVNYRIALAQGATSASEKMRYFVVNGTAGGPRILLTPPPAVTGTYGQVWYYRNANRLEDDADVCDIPEFQQFIMDTMREYVQWKAGAGSPKHQDAVRKTAESRELMMVTLRDMVVDGSGQIEQDMSHYEEHL